MRNYYKVAGLMSIVVLALSLIAVAQTSSQSSQPQTSPSTTLPSSSQGQATSPQATPNSQPGSAAAGQQGSAAQPGSVEDELQLTDAQKQKLRPIIEDEINQINAVRSDQSMSMDQKRDKVEKIRQTQFPKIQAILTPEQIAKLKQMQQNARPQQPGAPPSSPQAPPQ
jgi:Spy/CpxP family protein refolding chaperone